MAQTNLYGALRELFVTAAASAAEPMSKAPLPAEGDLSVRGIEIARGFVGALLPSRMWADAFLAAVFVGLSILLIVSIVTNCQRLGCAFVKLGMLCVLLVLTVFWLVTLGRLSDAEFHGSFRLAGAWLTRTVTDGWTTVNN